MAHSPIVQRCKNMAINRNENLAELTGIILGDGSFYLGKTTTELDIAFNSITEKEYANFVESLILSIIKTKVYRIQQKTKNCLHLRVGRKADVLSLLSNSIIKSGNKIENQVTIPNWIWQNYSFLRACVRGLFDTDGSLYRLKPHWPNLYQLSFKAYNKRLLNDARRALLTLGFNPSKTFDNRIVLTRQEEIKRYFKEIGANRLKYSPVV